MLNHYPVIDCVATGKNILHLRKKHNMSVRDLQEIFGFSEPQAIYKWQWGVSIPSVSNLYLLSKLFGVSMNEIIVEEEGEETSLDKEQSDLSDCSFFQFKSKQPYLL